MTERHSTLRDPLLEPIAPQQPVEATSTDDKVAVGPSIGGTIGTYGLPSSGEGEGR
jgi:hypothetical protein